MPRRLDEKYSKNWNCVWYPESLPKNWQEILEEKSIPYIYNLHDKDIEPTGEIKKAHYHITLCFDADKPYKDIKKLCDDFNQPKPEKCESLRYSVRYMVHLDQPDKYQYFRQDGILPKNVGALSDEKFKQLLENTTAMNHDMLDDMLDYINENDIFWYNRFIDYCRKNNRDWYDLLTEKYTYFITQYLKAKHSDMLEEKMQSR